jgi:hypothetical protein
MKQAMKPAGPGQTVRSWMCTCGHVMFFPDATIERIRRRGGAVCGACLGPLTLCAPLEHDRPGQNFYRRHYDCPNGSTEIEWRRAMGERLHYMLWVWQAKFQLVAKLFERKSWPNGTPYELAVSGARVEPCNA